MNPEKTGVMEMVVPALEAGNSVLDDLLAPRLHPGPKGGSRVDLSGPFNTLVGKLVGFTESGIPLVDFDGNPNHHSLPARHTCLVAPVDIDREVVLVFENNDSRKPIIMGLLQSSDITRNETLLTPVNATVDGEQITLTGKNEIILRCGKASITLTRAGKIIIRGAYVLTRSSGVNRIKGGSVQIN